MWIWVYMLAVTAPCLPNVNRVNSLLIFYHHPKISKATAIHMQPNAPPQQIVAVCALACLQATSGAKIYV